MIILIQGKICIIIGKGYQQLTHCGLVMSKIWVKIGSGNGLLPHGTKPLPEPMLIYHLLGPVIFIWEQFYKIHISHQLLKLAWKLFI